MKHLVIVKGVSVLAESVLRRGRAEYQDDYLEDKFKSFEASLGVAFEYACRARRCAGPSGVLARTVQERNLWSSSHRAKLPAKTVESTPVTKAAPSAKKGSKKR